MKLAPHLLNALLRVSNNCGDDIYFVFPDKSESTARSYLSKLKARGLAYTHVSGSTTEVWITKKGSSLLPSSSYSGYDHIHWTIFNGEPLDDKMGVTHGQPGPHEWEGCVRLVGRASDGRHYTLYGPITAKQYRALEIE